MLIYRLLVGVFVILHLGADHLFANGVEAPETTLNAFIQSVLTGTDSLIQLICAGLILIGLLVRPAAIPLIFFSVVEIVMGNWRPPTFHQILFSESAADSSLGAWSLVHDVYGAFIILFASVFLFFDGAGRPSADAMIMDRMMARRPPSEPVNVAAEP